MRVLTGQRIRESSIVGFTSQLVAERLLEQVRSAVVQGSLVVILPRDQVCSIADTMLDLCRRMSELKEEVVATRARLELESVNVDPHFPGGVVE